MSKIKRFMKMKVLSLLACALFSSVSLAQEMNEKNYVAMDLQARQATLEGVRDRLTLLELSADLSTQFEQDSQTQQAVEAIYTDSGMTSAQAITWATRNQQAIARWLADHPELQTEYDRIARELDEVSTQIQALVNQ